MVMSKGAVSQAQRGGQEVIAGERGSGASGPVGTQTSRCRRVRQRWGDFSQGSTVPSSPLQLFS